MGFKLASPPRGVALGAWRAPSTAGITPITAYRIQTHHGRKLVAAVTTTASVGSLRVGALKKHTRYTVTVQARNSAGWSKPSAAATFVTRR